MADGNSLRMFVADMRKSVAAGGGIRVSPGAGSYIDLLSDHEEPQLISR